MLTVHHLGHSQSERIVWLCEELELPYELKRYERRADNRMGPPAYKALHPLGTAPIITDDGITLAESGAIVEYLLARYGHGRLTQPGDPTYLYWLHFANGTLQPHLLRLMSLERAAPDHPITHAARDRLALLLSLLDRQLSTTPYLAGESLTAADIMTVFSLTTMRSFYPFELPVHIRAYVDRIRARPVYRRAMQKADPDLAPAE